VGRDTLTRSARAEVATARWEPAAPAYLPAMKKHTKLPVSRETLRTLDAEAIGHVKGAAPVTTRDLPCVPPPRD
jgi:hypothetical protein